MTNIEWTHPPGYRGANQSGPRNPNWKGGRSIASTGYVLIRVGVGHHLADVRGYAYEHRLVAELVLGRRLRDGEIVHHRDGNKINNAPENIEVVESIGHHLIRHRRSGALRRNPGEPNTSVECACGCGGSFDRFDSFGRPRKYISGHNMRCANGSY